MRWTLKHCWELERRQPVQELLFERQRMGVLSIQTRVVDRRRAAITRGVRLRINLMSTSDGCGRRHNGRTWGCLLHALQKPHVAIDPSRIEIRLCRQLDFA